MYDMIRSRACRCRLPVEVGASDPALERMKAGGGAGTLGRGGMLTGARGGESRALGTTTLLAWGEPEVLRRVARRRADRHAAAAAGQAGWRRAQAVAGPCSCRCAAGCPRCRRRAGAEARRTFAARGRRARRRGRVPARRAGCLRRRMASGRARPGQLTRRNRCASWANRPRRSNQCSATSMRRH